MTSEQKVKQVYPEAESFRQATRNARMRFSITHGGPRKFIVLGEADGREQNAWADAWRRIQASKKAADSGTRERK